MHANKLNVSVFLVANIPAGHLYICMPSRLSSYCIGLGDQHCKKFKQGEVWMKVEGQAAYFLVHLFWPANIYLIFYSYKHILTPLPLRDKT
jgi:hypothetical protein